MANYSYKIIPSKLLLIFIFLVHFIAFLAICYTVIPLLVKFGLIISLIVHLAWLIRAKILLRGKNTIVACTFKSDAWILINQVGDRLPVVLLSDFVSRFLIILNFKDELSRKKYAIIFMYDSLLPKDFRRLARLLLWG